MSLADILAGVPQKTNTLAERLASYVPQGIRDFKNNPTEALFGHKAPEQLQNIDIYANSPTMDGLRYHQDFLKNNIDSLSPYSQGIVQQKGLPNVLNDIRYGKNNGIPEIRDAVNTFNSGFKKEGLPPLSKQIVSGISESPPRGGLLNDIAGGFRENSTSPFNIQNWNTNTLEDGRSKGLGYRLGEGLGSIARGLNNPVGRGLLTGAAVSAFGGSPLEATAYGLGSGVLNRGLRTSDSLYRNALQEQGIDTSNIGGYINDNMFKNYALNNYRNRNLDIKEQLGILKDNTSRARMIAQMLNNNMITPSTAAEQMQLYGITVDDLKISNQTRNANVNEYLAPSKEQALKMAPQIALRNLELRQSEFEERKNNRNIPDFNSIASLRNEFSSLPSVKTFSEIQRQYKNIDSIYTDYNSGKLSRNMADQAMVMTLNKILDPTSVVRESEFARTAQGQALFDTIQGYAGKIGHGGSGLTDKERNDLVNAVKIMYNAAESSIKKDVKAYEDLAYRYHINPSDIMPRHYTANNNENQEQYNKKSKVYEF